MSKNYLGSLNYEYGCTFEEFCDMNETKYPVNYDDYMDLQREEYEDKFSEFYGY